MHQADTPVNPKVVEISDDAVNLLVPENLVPLAGTLLEYGVAYVPPAGGGHSRAFAGEELDFFELDIVISGPSMEM